MKKNLLTVLVAVIMIIPTIVALCYYVITKDSPITSGSVTSITLKMPHDGKTEEPESFVFDESKGKLDLNDISTNMLGYFSEVSKISKKVSGLPDTLKGIPHYTVTFTNYNRPVEYKFYYTEQPDRCYYTDVNNKCYNIPEDYAKAFLLSVYGMKVFDTADIPVASTPEVEYIEPVSVKWSYLTIDNLYPTYTEKNDDAYTGKEYTFHNDLNLTFTNGPGAPSSQYVDILDSDGAAIYSGSLDKGKAEIPKNQTIEVQLTAKWERGEKVCEGELVYRFKCKIIDSPEFTITSSADNIEAGYFLTVTGKNVSCEPDKIELTSEPDIGVKPVFYKDGDLVRAVIPLPYGLEAGTYTFKFTANGIETMPREHTLEIEEYYYKGNSPRLEEISSSSLTEASLEEFNGNMKDILCAKSDERYFDGEFIYPVSGSSVKSGFGRTLVTNAGYEYVNEWVRVSSRTGNDILAMNNGKVVYVGEQTLSGKTVVVDHGLGLMTVYANFKDVDVKVGDVVSTGDVLGTSGMSGYTDGNQVSVAFTVNGTYVCPYEIWDEEGIILE